MSTNPLQLPSELVDDSDTNSKRSFKYTHLWTEVIVWVAALIFWAATTTQRRDTLGHPNMYVQDILPVTSPTLSLLTPSEFRDTDMLTNNMNLTKLYADNMDHGGVLGNMGLTVFAAAKYSATCYGNREPWHLALRYHSETICPHTLQAGSHLDSSKYPGHDDLTKEIWNAEDSDDHLMRALLLEKWQRETQGVQKILQSRSKCSCMDSIHAAGTNSTIYAELRETFKLRIAALFAQNATLRQQRFRSYLEHDYFDKNTTHDTVLHEIRASFPSSGSVQDDLSLIVADMLPSNMMLANDAVDTPGVLEFCDRLSVPDYTIKFVGRMDSWLYIVLGQAILLISCWYNFQLSYVYWATRQSSTITLLEKYEFKRATQEVKESKKTITSLFHYMVDAAAGKPKPLFIAIVSLRGLMIVGTIIGVWASLKNTPDRFDNTERIPNQDTSAGSRYEATRFSPTMDLDTKYFAMVTVALGFVAFVELVLVYFIFKKREPAESISVVIVVRVRVLYTVARDLMNILALTTLSVGVALQMGMQYFAIILVFSSIVFVAGVVQHVANLLNIIFDLCAAGLLLKEPLHNVMDNLQPDDNRHVMMRRICLVRGLTYVCILIAVVVLVTHVSVTKVHSAVTDTKAALGVFLAVLVFSVLSAYEFMFDFFDTRKDKDITEVISNKMNDRRWTHTLVVCLYVIFASSIASTMR